MIHVLQEFTLPDNVIATTSAAEAIQDAQFAVHAVPVQHTRRFLDSIKVCPIWTMQYCLRSPPLSIFGSVVSLSTGMSMNSTRLPDHRPLVMTNAIKVLRLYRA